MPLRTLPNAPVEPSLESIGTVLTVGRRARSFPKGFDFWPIWDKRVPVEKWADAGGDVDEHGKKAYPGSPIFRDRFRWARKIKARRDDGSKFPIDDKPTDERFSTLHGDPLEWGSDGRGDSALTVVYAKVTLPEKGDVFDDKLIAWKAPPGEGANPNVSGPWCRGNRTQADRWDGAAKDWVAIPCPGDGCPYRQVWKDRKNREYVPCKEHARFYFEQRWPGHLGLEIELPILPFKLNSGGIEARESFVGMLAKLKKEAKAQRVEIKTLAGLLVQIELSMKRSKLRKSLYPAISFSAENTLQWLHWQESLSTKQIGVPAAAGLLGARSGSEMNPKEILSDVQSLLPAPVRTSSVPASKPAAVADPAVIEDVEVEDPGPITDDPRSLREIIAEDYAGTGLNSFATTKILRAAKLLAPTESFSKVSVKRLAEIPADKARAAIDRHLDAEKGAKA